MVRKRKSPSKITCGNIIKNRDFDKIKFGNIELIASLYRFK